MKRQNDTTSDEELRSALLEAKSMEERWEIYVIDQKYSNQALVMFWMLFLCMEMNNLFNKPSIWLKENGVYCNLSWSDERSIFRFHINSQLCTSVTKACSMNMLVYLLLTTHPLLPTFLTFPFQIIRSNVLLHTIKGWTVWGTSQSVLSSQLQGCSS